MPAVLIFGASGYIGQFLVQAFAATGSWTVYAVQNSNTIPWPATVNALQCDLTDSAAVAAVIAAAAPDVVVNCAAMAALGACETSPERAMAINCPATLIPTLNALPALARPFFVQFSTDIVFPGHDNGTKPYDESDDVSEDTAVNAYGKSKAAFERALMSTAEFPHTILRLSNVLGPLPPYKASPTTVKFVEWLVNEVRAHRPVKAFVDEYRSYVAVTDVADSVVALSNAAADASQRHTIGSVYHVGGPSALNRVAVAQAVASVLLSTDDAVAAAVIPTSRSDVAMPYASPLNVSMDSARVQRFIGRPFLDVLAYLRDVVVPSFPTA